MKRLLGLKVAHLNGIGDYNHIFPMGLGGFAEPVTQPSTPDVGSACDMHWLTLF